MIKVITEIEDYTDYYIQNIAWNVTTLKDLINDIWESIEHVHGLVDRKRTDFNEDTLDILNAWIKEHDYKPFITEIPTDEDLKTMNINLHDIKEYIL